MREGTGRKFQEKATQAQCQSKIERSVIILKKNQRDKGWRRLRILEKRWSCYDAGSGTAVRSCEGAQVLSTLSPQLCVCFRPVASIRSNATPNHLHRVLQNVKRPHTAFMSELDLDLEKLIFSFVNTNSQTPGKFSWKPRQSSMSPMAGPGGTDKSAFSEIKYLWQAAIAACKSLQNRKFWSKFTRLSSRAAMLLIFFILQK